MYAPSSRFYIGIDPSLTSTGLVIIGQNHPHTQLIQPKELRGVSRLDYILSAVEEALLTCMGDGLCELYAAIEGPALHAVNRADDLGQVRGILLLHLYRSHVSTLTIAPTSLKKFATGNGQANKDKMISTAATELDRELSNDEADAYWLARVAESYYGEVFHLTRAQREVLHGIRKPKAKKSSPKLSRDISV